EPDAARRRDLADDGLAPIHVQGPGHADDLIVVPGQRELLLSARAAQRAAGVAVHDRPIHASATKGLGPAEVADAVARIRSGAKEQVAPVETATALYGEPTAVGHRQGRPQAPVEPEARDRELAARDVSAQARAGPAAHASGIFRELAIAADAQD